jgi:hypothetical protein
MSATDALYHIYAECGNIACVAFRAEDRREESIMIARLLCKLSFTRHYGAYGAHEWDAYAGDDGD